ncbi:hypothetical protein C8Q79DRAFT_273541 [Trametes meyenii]|nr:hypothetical protein C8Q79DRAFT_273541 [Trametes meyenii]
MSHTHSHAPGQPSHSHGPAPPQQQQQTMVMRPPDPLMQAVIEESFRPVEIALGAPENAVALCGKHKLEKCADCNEDHRSLNRLSRLLVANPNLRCPPPPQVVSQNLSQAINNTKDEGNTMFKGGHHVQAIQRYTMAASIAVQRPPWEAQQLMREELSMILSNRSAAFFEAGDFVSALVDAETVVQLKRPWSKGHFRKARALMKLDHYEEAREAIQLGLSFEPTNPEMLQMLADIESHLDVPETGLEKASPQPIPVA